MKFNLLKKIKKDVLGIDLGSNNTIIYSKNDKKILTEKSVLSYFAGDKYFCGNDVQKINFFSEKIINPIKNGTVNDLVFAEKMIRNFISKIKNQEISPMKYDVIAGVSFQISEIEKKYLQELLDSCESRNVLFVYKNIASAIGTNLQNNSIIVDIGGGTTEMSVISDNNIVENKCFKFGGNDIDKLISEYIEYKYDVYVGNNISNKIKEQIGCVYLNKNSKQKKITIYGRNLNSKKPEKIVISQEDIVIACAKFTNLLIKNLIDLLDLTPPELLSDITKNGITFCGGTSQIEGLSFVIKNVTGINANFVKDPQFCLAKGLQKIIENYNSYKDIVFRFF